MWHRRKNSLVTSIALAHRWEVQDHEKTSQLPRSSPNLTIWPCPRTYSVRILCLYRLRTPVRFQSPKSLIHNQNLLSHSCLQMVKRAITDSNWRRWELTQNWIKMTNAVNLSNRIGAVAVANHRKRTKSWFIPSKLALQWLHRSWWAKPNRST